LTEAQRKAITEAENAILRIVAETRGRLTETGIDFRGEDGDFSCTRCDCEFFMSPPGRPILACKRQGCGHSFTLHRVQ
jgi:hypothetical protein